MSQGGIARKGICRNCGCGPTIKAHLIPRALFLDLKGNQKHLFLGSADEFGRKHSQSGIYDEDILCAKCDRYLGDNYDKFGIDFFREFPSKSRVFKHPVYVNGRTSIEDFFELEPFDSDKIVRFIVSILWRFSISSIPEAAKITLGPFEEAFRRILFSDASCATEPAIILYRYRCKKIPPENILFPPFRHKFLQADLNGYCLCVSGFRINIKTDSRRTPFNLQELTINGKSKLEVAPFVRTVWRLS